jgi:hypothetical protein
MSAIAGPVDRTSLSQARIALFRSLFRGRDDIYPRRFEGRNNGQVRLRSCGEGIRIRVSIADVEYANRDSRDLLAMVQPQVRCLGEKDIPSITAQIRLPSGDHVQFYGVHPRPPRPGDDTGDRDTELTLVAREIRGQRRPAILAGDLNDVAWSRTSRQLQQTAALRDPRVGRGLFATFNANLPAGVRWPLDHVFVSDDFALCVLERQGDIGSDHFPLLVAVRLQPEGSQP